MTKVLEPFQLEIEIKKLKHQGKKIGLCHGVFDLVHIGHINHFIKCKQMVDHLVVSITDEQFINKGPGRPFFSNIQRAIFLENIDVVDFVVIDKSLNAEKIILQIKPDFYFKGSDYQDLVSDLSGNILKEKNAIESVHGKIFFTNEESSSSSRLINSFAFENNLKLKNSIKIIQNEFNQIGIDEIFANMSKLRILLVGETIIDKYTTVKALGKSSKDPLLCFNKDASSEQLGGILAVANNCADFVSQVTVLTEYATESEKFIKSNLSNNVNLFNIGNGNSKTIKKERFFENISKNKVFELYELKDSINQMWQENKITKIFDSTVSNADLILVFDYGHGLITNEFAVKISNTRKFLAVNAQINGGNRGFNSITRYPRFNFGSLNLGELQNEARVQHLELGELIEIISNRIDFDQIMITKGMDGIEIWRKDHKVTEFPSFSPKVIDRVGAGDAVMSIASLLAHLNVDPKFILFIGNLIGAWAVSFQGNEKRLLKSDLLKMVGSTLK
jgi:cytidyltransferase-like protein